MDTQDHRHTDDLGTPLEDQLTDLLTAAVADPPGNAQRLAQVHARARRRRRSRTLAATGSIALVVTAVALTSTLLSSGNTPAPTVTAAGPSATDSSDDTSGLAALFSCLLYTSDAADE